MQASYFGKSAEAEVRMKRADGSYVWTEIRCRPAEAVPGQEAVLILAWVRATQALHSRAPRFGLKSRLAL